MNPTQKLISDSLILVGIVLAAIGWTGKNVGGTSSVISYAMMGLGFLLVLFGGWRYLKGNK